MSPLEHRIGKGKEARFSQYHLGVAIIFDQFKPRPLQLEFLNVVECWGFFCFFFFEMFDDHNLVENLKK